MRHAHSRKRALALIVTLVMIAGILPMNVFAAGAVPGYGEAPGYSDTAGHWASPAIEKWSGYGVLDGYAGSFRPNDPITRAEMAAVMQRVLGYTDMGENPFTDVEHGKWYYDDVVKLATAGIMTGYAGKARPKDNITREETATLIVRAFDMPALDADPSPFHDVGSVSDWAKGAVNALHAAGYINGKPGNVFDPVASITRAEVVTIVDNLVNGFYNEPGEYGGAISGNVVVRADGVALKDMTVDGDLYVTAGVGTGKVTLDNVTVSGQIFNLGNGNIVDNDGNDIPTSGPVPTADGSTIGGGSGGGNTGDKVTVSFNTNGAQPIPPVQIARGSTLQQIPVPGKASAAFTGWYTDSGLKDAFLSEEPIMNSMTLYADYADREYDAIESVPPDVAIKGLVDKNYPVTVLSSTGLSSGNLSDYIYITSDMDKDIPALIVSGGGGRYTLTPSPAYREGCRYTVALLDDALTFDGFDPGVRTLSFRVYKDETEVVEFADGITDVLWTHVTVIEEDEGDGGVYDVYPAGSYSIYMGDTVRFWDGELNQNTRYFKVMFVTKDTVSNRLRLEVVEASLGDIYKNIDVFLSQQQVDLSDYIEQLDLEKLAQEVQDGEGVAHIGDMLSRAVSQSPTIMSMLYAPESATKQDIQISPLAGQGSWRFPIGTPASGFQKPSMVGMQTIPGSQLLFNKFDSVEVSVKAGMTDNINFVAPNYWAYYSGEDQDCWEVVELQIKYSAKIENKVQIEAVVTVREYLSALLAMAVDYDFDFWHPSTWNDLTFSFESWLYSQTDVAISVIAKSIDKDPEFAYQIDITKEIENLTKEKPDDADPAAMLEKVLGDKGDYIDLVSANITTVELDIIPEIPVLQAELKLDLVVRVNFAAGISTGITYLGARMIELSADLDSLDFTANNYSVAGDGLYDIDIYAAGYLGVKVGLRGGAYVSIVGLKDLGKVGIELEFGAYADLYGFVHFNIHKYTPVSSVSMSLEGGLLFEFGIYLEMSLVAESKYFKAKAGWTFLDLKWPLFNIGEQYVLSKFISGSGGGDYALMRGDVMPMQGGGLFNAEFIDLKTGKRVNGSLAAPDKFEVIFSNKNFYVDGSGNIRLNTAVVGDAKRAEATAYVYYRGALISFGSPALGYITSGSASSSLAEWPFEELLGKVKLIWIDPALDISGIPDLDQVFTATYILKADGAEIWRGTREVFAGMIPGATDIMNHSKYIYGYGYSWLDYLKYIERLTVTGYDDFYTPITGNTTYVIETATIQGMVSFVTYDGASEKWRRDIYAVNVDERPTEPAAVSGKNFLWYCYSNPRLNWKYYPFFGVNPLFQTPRNVHYGYPTDTPVYTFWGSYEDCIKDTGGFDCEEGYIAEYAPNYFKITLNIPDQDIFGITYSAQYKSVRFDAEEGKQITVSSNTMSFLRDMYPGCVIAGFDANGDGIADYTKDNLPIATSDMEFDVVYTFNGATGTGYKAIFRTEYGEFRYGGVSVGKEYVIDMPGISSEFIKAAVDSFTKENRVFDFEPASTGDGKAMLFSGWNVLYTSAREILYDAVWKQDGVYYTLTFDAGDGLLNMPADTVYWLVSSRAYTLAVPVKPTDLTPPTVAGYNVEFIGWRDQNGVLYTDDIRNVTEDLRLTAEYKKTLTHGVSLSESGVYTFATATVGYAPVSARTITVTNTGSQNTGALTVTLSGTDASSFTLSKTSIGGISVYTTDTFTVKPNDGLAAGTYTATVTVSGGNGISADFGVSFTVNPPVPTYGVSLSESGVYAFTAETIGYGTVSARTITVTNTGNQMTGALTAALSGAGASSFTLSAASIGSIAVSGNGTFTVRPIDGLAAGAYTATVTVSGDNGITADFGVSFTVNPTTASYGVTLSESGTYEFTARIVGYGTAPVRTITVTNTGNQATGALTVALSGTDALSFTLSATSMGSIAVSGNDTFSVEPKDGLMVGTYNATVTVSGGNGISASFGVSFTVNPPVPLPTGIFISDGMRTEDINSVNFGGSYIPIEGYSYELEGTWVWVNDVNGPGWGDWVEEAPFIPTLFIWGDGLTVSGTVDGVVTGIEDTIRIVVEDGVEDVTFEDLSLTAKYPTSMISLGSYSDAMTVTFKGDCSFELENGDSVFYTFVKDLLFVGADASTKLTITAGDYPAGIVYWLTGNFTIRDLDVTMIDASFENSEGTCRLRFEDANIKTNYIIGLRGYLEIAGNTHFEAEYIGWPSIRLGDYFGGGVGQLIFDEFEGEFEISLGSASVRYPAIVVFNRFKFIVGGVELDPSDYDTYYDFGGLEIMRVYDEDEYWYGYTDGYYWTFGDGVDPAAQVAIKKKP